MIKPRNRGLIVEVGEGLMSRRKTNGNKEKQRFSIKKISGRTASVLIGFTRQIRHMRAGQGHRTASIP